MASLKDMRNRIASVKATRKITKAMQMVAAAKLRRAQEAAQAARPYAVRMAKVLSSIASKVADKGSAPPLLVGFAVRKVQSADDGRRTDGPAAKPALPGGARAPPECLICVTRPAGAAPHPAFTNAS